MRPTFFLHWTHGDIVVVYNLARIILKKTGCDDIYRLDIIDNHLTETILATHENLIPERLGAREDARKPYAITNNLDDVKLQWCFGTQKASRSVLDEITRLEVEHLQQKLNLGQVILGTLVLNLACQGTLDFDETTRLGDTVGRTTKPLVYRVLNQTNLVRLLIVLGVIHVTRDRLEECTMCRCGVSVPLVMAALFHDEIARLFVGIITDSRCQVARREHGSTEGVPFGRSLIVVGLLKELLHARVNFIHISYTCANYV